MTPDEFKRNADQFANSVNQVYSALYEENRGRLDTIQGLEQQNQEMHLTNLQLIDRNLTLSRENDALKAENAALREHDATHHEVPPPPPPVIKKPLIGISNGPKIDGACDRWFDSADGIGKVAPRRTKALCPRVHASWKLLGDPDPKDAQIVNAFKNLLDDDKVEAEHEIDVKYRKDIKNGVPRTQALATLQERIRIKNRFYDQVVRLREAGDIPDVDVVATQSAWSFWQLAGGPKDAANYIAKADVLGVDLDGDDARDGYMDYAEPTLLLAIVTFADQHYGGRWTAPEHGWNSTVVGQRMPHFRRTIPAIAQFKPEEIQVFDNAGWAPLLTASELNELKVLVNQYNL